MTEAVHNPCSRAGNVGNRDAATEMELKTATTMMTRLENLG